MSSEANTKAKGYIADYNPILILKLALPLLIKIQGQIDLNPKTESKIVLLGSAGGMIGDNFKPEKSYYNQENLTPNKLLQCLTSLSSVLHDLLEFENDTIEAVVPRSALMALYLISNRDISVLAEKHNIDLQEYEFQFDEVAIDIFSLPDHIFEFVKQYSSFLKEFDAAHINQGKSHKAKGGTKSFYTKLFNQCVNERAEDNLKICADFFQERATVVQRNSLKGSQLVLQTLSAAQEFCSVFSVKEGDPEANDNTSNGKILTFAKKATPA